MLDLMLGNSPDAFSCGEVNAWFRPHRPHHFRLECACQAEPCPVWERLKGVPESSFHEAVFREMNVDFVIDSSKALDWVIDTCRWAPQARVLNIAIWKDPIHILYSYWKRDRNLQTIKRKFNTSYVRYYARLLALDIPFMSVHYRQLAEAPQVALSTICAKIGMTYAAGKEHFWLKTHHHLFGSNGVRKQVTNKHSVIYRAEARDEGFESSQDELERFVVRHSKLQRLLDELERREVGRVEAATEAGTRHVRRPAFYYYHRAKRLIGMKQPKTPEVIRSETR